MKPPEHPAPGMDTPPLDDPDPLLDPPGAPSGPEELLVCPPHPASAAPSVKATTVVPMFTRASFAAGRA
jgi:hypothetical protein